LVRSPVAGVVVEVVGLFTELFEVLRVTNAMIRAIARATMTTIDPMVCTRDRGLFGEVAVTGEAPG
jgi:hypothetical protein